MNEHNDKPGEYECDHGAWASRCHWCWQRYAEQLEASPSANGERTPLQRRALIRWRANSAWRQFYERRQGMRADEEKEEFLDIVTDAFMDAPLEAESATLPHINVHGLVNLIVRDVAELPDRTSPDDWPEALIVEDGELRSIIIDRLTEALSPMDSSTKEKP